MGFIHYYRDPEYPYYSVKKCVGQSHASRKHAHTQLGIALVTGGQSVFRFGEDAHHIHSRQLVMIGPGFVHQCLPEDVDSWCFFMLFIEPGWLEAAGIAERIRPSFAVKDLTPDEFTELKGMMEQLCSREGAADEILLYILDRIMEEPPDMVVATAENGAGTSLEAVAAYIRSHYAESLCLDVLADIAGLSKFLLIRNFSKCYNTTPLAWQSILRLNEGRLLLEKKEPIADVAIKLGFYDQSHFTKRFKAHFGVTPKAFVSQIFGE